MRSLPVIAATFLVLCSQASAADGSTATANTPSLSASVNPAPAGLVLLNPYTSGSPATQTPIAPRPRVVDRRFLGLSAMAVSTIFTDSYTTSWIGANYRSRGYGFCTVEGGEPRLYGLHPTAARSYAVGAGMAAGAVAVSYLAKRYLPRRAKFLWPAPLLYETAASVAGFSTNLARCNP